MPIRVVKRASVITALTFIVWLAFAVVFPDDRLDVGETIFVWVTIAVTLMVCRLMILALIKSRTRGGKRGRKASV
jgi:hypothetical protein